MVTLYVVFNDKDYGGMKHRTVEGISVNCVFGILMHTLLIYV